VSAPSRGRSERGQTVVEFAVILQVFLLLLFGVYQGGVTYFHKLTLEQATRDGARTAIVQRSAGSASVTSKATAAVRKTAGSLDGSQLSVTVTSSDNPEAKNGVLWERGDVVSVTATYPWKLSLIGLTLFDGKLSATTSLRLE
jgi:Flp pilus assembly protein TadG